MTSFDEGVNSKKTDNDQDTTGTNPVSVNTACCTTEEEAVEVELQVALRLDEAKANNDATKTTSGSTQAMSITNTKSNASNITATITTFITSIINQNINKETIETYSQQMIQIILQNPFLSFFIITILSILYSKTPSSFTILSLLFQQLYHLCMRIIGTAIGIAVGLGFAIHIRELLDEAFHNHYQQENGIHNNDDTGNSTTISSNNYEIQQKTASSTFLSSSLLSKNTGSLHFIQNPFMNKNNEKSFHHLTQNTLTESSTTIINHELMDSSSSPFTNNNTNTSPSTYQILMTNAGYAIPKNHLLRGQILRNVPLNDEGDLDNYIYCEEDVAKRKSLYRFPVPTINNGSDNDDNSNKEIDTINNEEENNSKGQLIFSRMWPNIPQPVQKELGLLVDYILRDYITSWYGYVDSGVQYEDAKIQKNRIDEEAKIYRKKKREDDKTVMDHQERDENEKRRTTMVLSTSAIRTIPFLEILYTSLTVVLGNLSTFVGDNVNIAELVLLKLVHILKVNIRTYRKIRDTVLEKGGSKRSRGIMRRASNNNDGTNNNGDDDGHTPTLSKKIEPVSEISIIREYLVQGKLHRAMTFGMDVPGLLFGDMKGEECPLPETYTDSSGQSEKIGEGDQNKADDILKRRLFGMNSRVLYECELDYNRVISHRLGRILFQRADFHSPILRSAIVEMLASCVITPIMGCATPDYINTLILTMLEDASTTQAQEDCLKSKVNLDLADNLEPEETLQIFGDVDDEEEDDIEENQDMEHHNNLEASDDEVTLEDDVNEYEDEITNHDSIDALSPSMKNSIDMSMVTPNSASLEIPNMRMATNDSIDISIAAAPESADIEIANSGEISYMDPSDEILALLSMALIEIGAYVDYDDARRAKQMGEVLEVNWSDKGCKEVIRNLVLVIEAVLIHGLRSSQHTSEHTSLINLLLEVTSDLESFENRSSRNADMIGHVREIEEFENDDQIEVHQIPKPDMNDLERLRTLIISWLHTGLVYRTLSALVQNDNMLLTPFYHKDSFILESDNFVAFLRQLRLLHEVELIVDTTIVLPCPPLNLFQIDRISDEPSSFFPPPLVESSNDDLVDSKALSPNSIKPVMKLTRGLQVQAKPRTGMPQLGRSIKANFENNKKKITTFVRVGANIDKNAKRFISAQRVISTDGSPTNSRSRVPATNQPLPSHLNFHRNEVFATSLRNERDTRMQSFLHVFNGPRSTVEMICRSRIRSEKHFAQHRELHNLAKCFYFNTNALILRAESRKIVSNTEDETAPIEASLVLETITSRRKTSIPEDDSSFLLRAQPCPLNIVSIHRDQRDSSLSYKKYVGYYDEPILDARTKVDRGGRLRRRCFVRYYPNDRTASITFIQVDRRLDYRDKKISNSYISVDDIDFESRPKEFERLPCNKFVRKGSERSVATLSNSILASTLMDSTDFSSIPRSGKAIDFLYRASLFEEPAIELSGKRIIVQDASAIGCHQADASSLELSDASLSTALLMNSHGEDKHFFVKCDSNDIPLVFMKIVESTSNSSSSEAKADPVYKSFRTSFVRSALLVASSKEEAKLTVCHSYF